MSTLGMLAVSAGVLLLSNVLYLVWYVRWEARNTGGMAYYGRPSAERRALKRRIRLYSAPTMPLVRLLARAARAQAAAMPSFEYQGVFGPAKVSSASVFARAHRYEPRPEDVFVVTQMRCGTTWMQQVVYEIVTRGRGDLSDQGHGHLYAVCPWIEAINSVSMERAPLVGERPTRIVKSHLPTQLCPYSETAKYIYVTRHPVSCFASIVDFNRSLQGPFMPSVEALLDWFCSDRMYWLPWPKHVAGWWEWSESRRNVLFVHFEEMKHDLAGVRDRVAAFLGYTLTPEEGERVVARSGFRYMKEHEELFEMAPPTMFSVGEGRFMPSGGARDRDLPLEVQRRILEYCREALRETAYLNHTPYEDLARRTA